MTTIDTTIHRDAGGRVALTTEQAEALALWQCSRGPRPPFMDQLDTSPVGPIDLLCLWVLRYAPVVRAAEAQAIEVRSRVLGPGYTRACTQTVIAACTGRGEGEGTP